jgi:tol-pal system protein YbgF
MMGAQTVLRTPARNLRRQALALGFCVVAGVSLAGIATARADEFDDLRQQIEQLKQQVTLLQNQMPGAGAGVTAGGGTVAAQQVVQIQQLQQQMSQLQGQIEQIGIKADDLANRLDRLQKDTDFRLGRLEQGGAAGMAAPGAQADGAPAALPQTADQMSATTGAPPLQAPEGAQLPEPTAPGTLGTIASNVPLPQAPAGAAEAAATAAGQAAPATPAQPDPASIQLPGNTPQEQYDYATGLLQRGAYPEAELAFKAFIAQHPKDPLAGNAQYWLGETYYARSDYQHAASAFAEGYQKYKSGSKAPDNLLKLGMSLGQTGKKDNACLAFRQLAKEYPNASASIKDRAARAQQRYGCPAS